MTLTINSDQAILVSLIVLDLLSSLGIALFVAF